MQRIEADERGALLRARAHDSSQVREVADAPVLLRAQRVELHRHAPQPAAVAQHRRLVTRQRCHDECAGFARAAVERDVQRVITVRQIAWQRQLAPRLPAAVDLAPFVLLQVGGARATADLVAASDDDAPVEFAFE